MLKTFLKKINNLGVKKEYSPSVILTIMNLNRLLLFVFVVGVLNFLSDYWNGFYLYSVFDILPCLFVIILLILNYFYFHKLSSHLFMIFLNLIVFAAASSNGRETGLVLFFLPLLLVGIFLIGIQEKKILLFYISLSVILLLVVIFTDYTLFQTEEMKQADSLFLFRETLFNLILFTGYGLFNIILTNYKMESHFIKEKANLDAIINNSLLNIVLLDKNRQIRAFNQLAFDFVKNERNLILKENVDILEYLSIKEQKKFQISYIQVLKGEMIQIEKKYTSSLGDRWFEIHFSPTLTEKGELDGIVFSSIEITERKQNEREIKLGRLKAEEANIAKSQFLSTMSHEIRTPMNAVIGMAGILLENNPRPEQVKYLNILKLSSENLLTLINDILDFNQIDLGKIELDEEEFSLRQFSYTLMSFISPLVQDKKINLVLNYDENIPYIVVGDSVRLSQIITNLMSNAIKFTEEGEVSLNVNLEEQKMDTVRIGFAVKDTGVGIPAEGIKSIFENFTQGGSDVFRKYGGSGLGLAIAKRILDLQNSPIFVESEIGKGSNFYFSLEFRFSNSPSTNLEITSQSKKGLFETDALKGIQVLLVDDYPINQIVVSEFLTKWHIELDYADNGLQALEKVKVNKYDLILMDLQMPDMDGYETTKRIRKMEVSQNIRIPIIALTASAVAEIYEEVKKSGLDDLISKPFDPEDLLQKLIQYSKKQ